MKGERVKKERGSDSQKQKATIKRNKEKTGIKLKEKRLKAKERGSDSRK